MQREEDFEKWLDTSKAGAVAIYHRGRLDLDRGTCLGTIWLAGAADHVANLAYAAFTDRKVHLFQRKLHDNCYEYIAMKRSKYGRNW